MSTTTHLLTAEEFAQLPNENGEVRELVRGRLVTMNQPFPRHGQVCSKVDRIVGGFADAQRLGHVVCNDTGLITEREPDTVRGGDVWYISYAKVAAGKLPARGYLHVVPEIVFEVVSPSDRRSRVLAKVAEYLEAGVTVVCVLDPADESVRVFRDDRPVLLVADEVLSFPDILPGFSTPVSRFFN